MTATIHWALELTALSSITHAGETRGTDTLLRRETVLTPNGPIPVPIVSGNALRGRLRRIAEELFRDTLQLEGLLSLPAAYALRNGGSLYKTGREPLTGSRRAQIRNLVLPIGIFGCAAGASIIDSCLEVGKVIPQVVETTNLTGVATNLSVFDLVQLEEYSHTDDLDHNASPAAGQDTTPDQANQMRYAIETFPAGTRLSTYLRLNRANDLHVAFFTDVLTTYSQHAQLGGRLAAGHGRIHLSAIDELVTGSYTPTDWRTHLLARRADVLHALELLS